MIYQITVDVESSSFIETPFAIDLPPYIVKAECDENKRVVQLIIQMRVTDYDEYLPVFFQEDDDTYVLDARLSKNPHFEKMIGLFQHIEALGGYLLKLSKVHWDEPIQQWIGETREEKIKLSVVKFPHPVKYYPEFHNKMNPKLLKLMIEEREKYIDLIIPFSFVRVGNNDFKSLRFVSAFYNFYFFLEDLFGEGNTKNNQVEKSFKNSPSLIRALETALDLYGKDAILSQKLQKLLSYENNNRDVDGLINLIVKIRGDLHHFSQKSSRKKAHPLNQSEFEPIAFLMMTICEFVLADIVSKRSPMFYSYLV